MDDTVFAGREEAGRLLADRYEGPKDDLVILGIARGGIATAYPMALKFHVPMDVVTTRKLPIPWSPEMGFGAIAPDGSIVLNDEVVRSFGISPREIKDISRKVLEEVHRREEVYRGGRAPVPLKGKNVIIADDGLATGYTMIAAIEMAKKQGAAYVVAAAAVSPVDTAERIRDIADALIVLRVARTYSFAVASFYRDFHDMKDSEVLDYMEKGRKALASA